MFLCLNTAGKEWQKMIKSEDPDLTVPKQFDLGLDYF